MAAVEDIPASKGPSLVIQAALIVGMTVAALGIGWFAGSYLKSSQAPAKVKPELAKHEAKAEEKGKDEKSHDPDAGPLLVELAPITTNLASPATVWVRLDASLVLDAPQPPETIEAVHQDLLALIRTIKMHQVEGGSGYQHLKADLQERASIRSGGHVKDVLIRTLVFE
ncbi:MAG TPA: flagellar basal body-associated FliL family protein [Mesorhizobium sp.]